MQPDRSGEACSCPLAGPPRALFNSDFECALQRADRFVPWRDGSAFDRRHQARVAASRRRVDAGHALDREARDIMRSAGLGPGAAQTLAAEWLAFDHRSDLVAVDVEIADAGMLLDIIADGVDAALQAEGEAVTGGVNVLDHLVELVAGEVNDVEDRSEIGRASCRERV